MKTSFKVIFLSILFVIAVPVFAESGFYIGGKTGVLEPDASGYDADNDNPLALHLGYRFGSLAIQAEAYSTENEVEAVGADAELDVVALYGVFRTDGFFYFMAKGGLVDGEITLSGVSEDDSSVSYGIGAGFNFADFIFIEAEYLVYDVEDVDIDFFGVSANFQF